MLLVWIASLVYSALTSANYVYNTRSPIETTAKMRRNVVVHKRHSDSHSINLDDIMRNVSENLERLPGRKDLNEALIYNEVLQNLTRVNSALKDLISNYQKLKTLYKSQESASHDYSSDVEIDEVYKEKNSRARKGKSVATTTSGLLATAMFLYDEGGSGADGNTDENNDENAENSSADKTEATTTKKPMEKKPISHIRQPASQNDDKIDTITNDGNYNYQDNALNKGSHNDEPGPAKTNKKSFPKKQSQNNEHISSAQTLGNNKFLKTKKLSAAKVDIAFGSTEKNRNVNLLHLKLRVKPKQENNNTIRKHHEVPRKVNITIVKPKAVLSTPQSLKFRNEKKKEVVYHLDDEINDFNGGDDDSTFIAQSDAFKESEFKESDSKETSNEEDELYGKNTNTQLSQMIAKRNVTKPHSKLKKNVVKFSENLTMDTTTITPDSESSLLPSRKIKLVKRNETMKMRNVPTEKRDLKFENRIWDELLIKRQSRIKKKTHDTRAVFRDGHSIINEGIPAARSLVPVNVEKKRSIESIEDDKIIAKEQFKTRILRKAYGDACLKVVVKKCFKACKAAVRDVSRRYSCKAKFKSDFQNFAKTSCIAEFRAGEPPSVVEIGRHSSPNVDFNDISRNGYLAAACLPIGRTDDEPTQRKSLPPQYNNYTGVIKLNILRDRFEKECQKISASRCTKACKDAADSTCAASECRGKKLKALYKSCKRKCKFSYKSKKSIEKKGEHSSKGSSSRSSSESGSSSSGSDSSGSIGDLTIEQKTKDDDKIEKVTESNKEKQLEKEHKELFETSSVKVQEVVAPKEPEGMRAKKIVTQKHSRKVLSTSPSTARH